VVVAHRGWDSQLFDVAHADGWMGRRLRGGFNAAGRVEGVVRSRVPTHMTYVPPRLGHASAQALGALVRRGLVGAAADERFLRAQAALSGRGDGLSCAGDASDRTRQAITTPRPLGPPTTTRS
jgi:hypothetical protein